MGKPFRVDVVTPEAVIWSGEAEMLTARTIEGDIGILADHEPTMAALATGAVVIHHEDGVTSAGVHGGFLQIANDEVKVLADAAEHADDISEDRADEARGRAQERLTSRQGPIGEGQFDTLRAQLAMQRALLRLKVRRRKHGSGAPSVRAS